MEALGSSKPMVEARVPIAYRDQCAKLLIPLNGCRQSKFYMTWKCEDESHSYEKCENELVMERMLQMQKLREEEEKAKLKHGSRATTISFIPKTANA